MRIFVLTFPAFSATRPGVPSELLNCAQVKSDQSSGAAARVCEPVGQSHLGGDCTRNWAPTINSIGPKKWFGITFRRCLDKKNRVAMSFACRLVCASSRILGLAHLEQFLQV